MDGTLAPPLDRLGRVSGAEGLLDSDTRVGCALDDTGRGMDGREVEEAYAQEGTSFLTFFAKRLC